MGFITRERAALQSTHPTQNVKLIIRYYLLQTFLNHPALFGILFSINTGFCLPAFAYPTTLLVFLLGNG